jgi:PTH1 family peptidyl-tRNA hydrolase
VGYTVLAELARRFGNGPAKTKFHGTVTEASLGGVSALLLSPGTYMNRSGTSVLAAQSFYKIELSDLLVLCDDLNLPIGKVRIRAGGSAGGQKGLEDIIRCLGTEEVPRLRVGIGQPPDAWDWADFVLSKFTEPEISLIQEAVPRAADAAVVWAQDGIQQCMNRYN